MKMNKTKKWWAPTKMKYALRIIEDLSQNDKD